ncbi:MAG: hypothetical protein MUC29_14625 [Pyrinomonadaceae bacterium]|nr:hypothetical protein [Pyrinomonadaceae bacterium]
MDSSDLMKLLIPEGKVKEVSRFTRLNTSLLYQERRPFGEVTDTGTRNTIARLDLFCEWNLDREPELVRIVGERYLRMYQNHISPPTEEVSLNDLLKVLAIASKECGESISALASRQSIKNCEVEVNQAKKALEMALAIVSRLDEKE